MWGISSRDLTDTKTADACFLYRMAYLHMTYTYPTVYFKSSLDYI